VNAQADADSKTGDWMRLGSRGLFAVFFAGIAFVALPATARSQEPGFGLPVAAAAELPAAPTPQVEVAAVDPPGQQPATSPSQSAQQPAPASTPNPSSAPATSPTGQGDSSSQPPAQQSTADQTKYEKAQQQLKQQEQQRILGIVPNFNLTYLGNETVSLSPKQKMNLALHSALDPFTFAAGFLVAGYHEVLNDDPGFPWGVKGYGERAGAAYLDAFDGDILGNGILPAVLHQDPRYYRMGQGTFRHRLLYSIATNFICRHDNTAKWEPNYSNIGGNIIAGALSNLYYPSASRSGVGLTFSNGFIVTAEGAVGSVFDEFWPDVSRKFLHKDPTRGIDAQVRAKAASQKQAQQNGK
jgi:hypothetical protein